MSCQEAAIVLGVPMATVGKLIGAGLLDRYRLRGRYVCVLRSQVDELATVDPEILRNA